MWWTLELGIFAGVLLGISFLRALPPCWMFTTGIRRTSGWSALWRALGILWDRGLIVTMYSVVLYAHCVLFLSYNVAVSWSCFLPSVSSHVGDSHTAGTLSMISSSSLLNTLPLINLSSLLCLWFSRLWMVYPLTRTSMVVVVFLGPLHILLNLATWHVRSQLCSISPIYVPSMRK